MARWTVFNCWRIKEFTECCTTTINSIEAESEAAEGKEMCEDGNDDPTRIGKLNQKHTKLHTLTDGKYHLHTRDTIQDLQIFAYFKNEKESEKPDNRIDEGRKGLPKN